MKKPRVREVAAFRFLWKCGHRGVVVAERRGVRSTSTARAQAEVRSLRCCPACYAQGER